MHICFIYVYWGMLKQRQRQRGLVPPRRHAMVLPVLLISGGTLLVQRMFSSAVANNAAVHGDPRHDEKRIKQMRSY